MAQQEGQQQLDIQNVSNQLQNEGSFDQFQLKEELLRGIYAYGFERPFKIQQYGINPIINGKDTIVQANAGTGKTIIYVIGVLQLIDVQLNQFQALILVPTRELAMSINQIIKSIGAFQNVSSHAIIGGVNLKNQIKAIQENAHIIVATPGRVLDLIKRRYLDFKYLKIFILDEAIDIFGRGFKKQIYELVQNLPNNTQSCIFSSTIETEILKFSFNFQRNPIKVSIKKDYLPIELLKYYYIKVEKEELKIDIMQSLIQSSGNNKFMIVCYDESQIEMIKEKLKVSGLSCVTISQKAQNQYNLQVLEEFSTEKVQILVISYQVYSSFRKNITQQVVSFIIIFDLQKEF